MSITYRRRGFISLSGSQGYYDFCTPCVLLVHVLKAVLSPLPGRFSDGIHKQFNTVSKRSFIFSLHLSAKAHKLRIRTLEHGSTEVEVEDEDHVFAEALLDILANAG